MTNTPTSSCEAFSRAYLYIQTDWNIKKNTQPLVSLSGLAQFREVKIELNDDIKNLPDLMSKAKQLAAEHYQHTGGRIDFWGKIESYLLCYRTAYYEPTKCVGPIWEMNNDD